MEDALRDFDGNYTEGEHGNLETKLETVKEALAAIKNAVKAADEIGKLPSVDDVKLGDREDVDRVKEIIDGLTENEKAMLGDGASGKIDALNKRIEKLEEAKNGGSPGTGDNSNIALWIALLFVSGGAIVGAAATGKKKKRSVR